MSHDKLRLIFMGTPDFSVAALKALIDAGHEVVAAYSQPPRKSGRGQKRTPSPLHAYAQSQGLEVRTPASFKDPGTAGDLTALKADAAVVVAYGLILPPAILQAPRLGCFNIHASVLPRWRGAAPIQRAIAAGDPYTGVSIMQMDQGLDTGPVVLAERVGIGADMNAHQLHDVLQDLGADLIVKALDGVASGLLVAQPQPQDGVTYAKKITKSETRIDWHRPAAEVAALVRALYPAAWFECDGQRVRVLAATVEPANGVPGQVLDDALLVACGTGAVRCGRVQPAGKSAMDATDYLRGHPLPRGTQVD